jgi:hypothetical protein
MTCCGELRFPLDWRQRTAWQLIQAFFAGSTGQPLHMAKRVDLTLFVPTVGVHITPPQLHPWRPTRRSSRHNRSPNIGHRHNSNTGRHAKDGPTDGFCVGSKPVPANAPMLMRPRASCRGVLTVAALSAAVLSLSHRAPDDSQLRLPGLPSRDRFGPLRFRTDGTFQVCIFEDLHFGESMSPVLCQVG